MKLNYTIHPRRIGLALGGMAVLLAILSFISEYLVEVVLSDGSSLLIYILDLFSVNLEESIPTWFSVLILFAAAVLLVVIAAAKCQARDPYTLHWSGLALLFVYLSLDEGAAIHEILAEPLQNQFNTTGFFAFGWQIAAIPLVVVFGLLYLRFLFHLPRYYQIGFILAGGMYIGGAIVIEGISANQWAVGGGVSMLYLAIATVEELFEMLGVVGFIYVLLNYIVDSGYELAFLASGGVAPAAQETTRQASLAKSGLRLINPAALAVLFLLGTNGALLWWVLDSEPQIAAPTETPFYQPIMADLAANQVTVVQMAGVSGIDDPDLRQMVTTLLDQHSQILVVVVPGTGESTIFSGDYLPVDAGQLTALLHASEQTQFIIFDTAMVSVLVNQP